MQKIQKDYELYFVHAYEYLCTQTVWKHIHSIVLLIAMEK